jgi:hypothetical protein
VRPVDRTPPDGANSGNNGPEETAMAVSAAAAGPSGLASRQSLSFVIGASSVGTLIEWYDLQPEASGDVS